MRTTPPPHYTTMQQQQPQPGQCLGKQHARRDTAYEQHIHNTMDGDDINVRGRGAVRYQRAVASATSGATFRPSRRNRGGRYGDVQEVGGEDVWPHDFYDEVEAMTDANLVGSTLASGGNRRRGGGSDVMSRLGPRVGNGIIEGSALQVAGLRPNVTEQDMQVLFSKVGPLVTCRLMYDARSSRPLGIAEVVFKHADDAMEAINKYNGVMLDGVPMKIHHKGTVLYTSQQNMKESMTTAVMQQKPRNRSVFVIKPNRAPISGSPARLGRRRSSLGRSGPKREPVTVDQLNQDMEEYMTKS
ncbi:polymerase delta-interacting protein 3 [Pelomyxa schiedti]|nr:polymerase delta-interacting protein 3 [Pelomyxa schiedti]